MHYEYVLVELHISATYGVEMPGNIFNGSSPCRRPETCENTH